MRSNLALPIRIALLLLIAGFGFLSPVAAHSPDGIHLTTSIEIEPTEIIVRTDLFAGDLIYLDLIAELDADGDGNLTESEITTWISTHWRPTTAFQIDAKTDAAPTAPMSAAFTGPLTGLFVAQPLSTVTTFAIPTDGLPHTLVVKQNYRWEQADYQFSLLTGTGAEASLASNTGRVVVVNFETDPQATGGNPVEVDSGSVLASQRRTFGERLQDAWLCIVSGLIALGVVGWLLWNRRRDAQASKAPVKPGKPAATSTGPVRKAPPPKKRKR
ncbi:MAG TPA: hypothetical protein PK691_08160 [Thermomicrobiales bacterium]|nr:hypothetical protein [Thermomicrobiales bacterium]